MSVGVARAHLIVGRFCAAMLTAGAMLGVAIGIPSAAAQPCPDIDVTFARGLGDAPGPGPLGDAFITRCAQRSAANQSGVWGQLPRHVERSEGLRRRRRCDQPCQLHDRQLSGHQVSAWWLLGGRGCR